MKPGETRYIVSVKRVTNEVRPRKEYKQIKAADDPEPYGYVEDEWWKEETTEIYIQVVEDLDVSALAAVVNKLDTP